MSYKILFIFEGLKTEPKISNCLQEHFFPDDTSNIIHNVFGSNIYSLYDVIKRDEHADVFEILREQNILPDDLKDLDRDDVGEIYLFFDHDGHDTRADIQKISELLSMFDNETENGRLYLNYPMVEAIKETDLFQNKTWEIAKNKKYKSYVSELGTYNDLMSLSKDDWNEMCLKHLKKANWIVNKDYALTTKNSIGQSSIFEQQVINFIQPLNSVSILSAFPLFVDDYFQENELEYRQ
ncbi:hypothetical protein PQO03_16600 [Lentisphaera profundi]|uniref:DUF4276 family protein n=1 Tax=Lentisphaera profundi TaxID=1658616 RepID=A0ABY7W1V6_9BACT|nr:hypothetical protein [Lentisphaera profundi]WDE99458.1 hypothetical protein PQO03_16600 [Lentisphaera profundi]